MLSALSGDRDCVAAQIKSYFAAAKKEQQGKPYRPSPKFNKPEFWTVAADICIELKADPYSFVRSAFLYCAVSGGPYPNQLCGNTIRHWYENYQKLNAGKSGEDIYTREIQAMLLAGYSTTKQNCISRKCSVKDYLLDEFTLLTSIPAFVRLVLMPKDPDIFRKWGRIAYSEIMGNQKLLSVLQNKNYDLSFLQRVEQETKRI